MSSVLLRNSLRAAASPRIIHRFFSVTPTVLNPVPEATPHNFSSTIHEDLQGVSSMELLSTGGLAKNPKMRHFTGMWVYLF